MQEDKKYNAEIRMLKKEVTQKSGKLNQNSKLLSPFLLPPSITKEYFRFFLFSTIGILPKLKSAFLFTLKYKKSNPTVVFLQKIFEKSYLK